MSQKFGNQQKGMGILSLAIVLWMGLLAAGCDPCYQLAEKICGCEQSDEKRRSCISNLGKAQEHHGFKNAKNAEVCEQAIKNCTCEKIADNSDAECGMYRPKVE
jgi:hypothetical protein